MKRPATDSVGNGSFFVVERYFAKDEIQHDDNHLVDYLGQRYALVQKADSDNHNGVIDNQGQYPQAEEPERLLHEKTEVPILRFKDENLIRNKGEENGDDPRDRVVEDVEPRFKFL